MQGGGRPEIPMVIHIGFRCQKKHRALSKTPTCYFLELPSLWDKPRYPAQIRVGRMVSYKSSD